MVQLTNHVIHPDDVLAAVSDDRSGAVLLFLGTARESTNGRKTQSLEYECYPEMALSQMTMLRETAMKQWPLVNCAIVHRLGPVALGEASVAVAVSSPHRAEAFAAGQWLIDTLKQVVPIWKKENWADGTTEWIHPVGPPHSQGDK